MVQRGLDYDLLYHVSEFKPNSQHWKDQSIMALSRHRMHLDSPDEQLWLFYRTKTSMQDFVHFVQYESTQVKADHDFYLGNDRNRSAKDANLVPKDKWVKF